jgi:hypothetical protein
MLGMAKRKTYDMAFEVWANGKPYWNSPKILCSKHEAEVQTEDPRCIAIQQSMKMMEAKFQGKGYLFPEIRITRFDRVD